MMLGAWDEEGADPDDRQPLFISFPARDKPLGWLPGWEQYEKRPETAIALLRQDLPPI
jgi:hypothetical protein